MKFLPEEFDRLAWTRWYHKSPRPKFNPVHIYSKLVAFTNICTKIKIPEYILNSLNIYSQCTVYLRSSAKRYKVTSLALCFIFTIWNQSSLLFSQSPVILRLVWESELYSIRKSLIINVTHADNITGTILPLF